MLNGKSKKLHVVVAVLFVVVMLSLSFNVYQFVRRQQIQTELASNSKGLQNYRELQEKQIESALTSCKKSYDEWFDYSKIGWFSFNLLYTNLGKEDLARAYKYGVANAGCYGAIFMLMGKKDIYTMSKERTTEITDGNIMNLKDGLFEEVRW